MPDPMSFINAAAPSRVPVGFESNSSLAGSVDAGGQGSFGQVMKQAMVADSKGFSAKDEPKTRADATQEAKTESQTESPQECNAASRSESNSKQDSKPAANNEANTETKAEVKQEAKTGREAESGADAKVEVATNTLDDGVFMPPVAPTTSAILPPDGALLPVVNANANASLTESAPATMSSAEAANNATVLETTTSTPASQGAALTLPLAAGSPVDMAALPSPQSVSKAMPLATNKASTDGAQPGLGAAYTLRGSGLKGQTSGAQPVPSAAAPLNTVNATTPDTKATPWDAELIRAAKEIMQPETGASQRPADVASVLPTLGTAVSALGAGRAAPVAAPPLNTSVDVGFHQPGWNDAFTNRVAWLVKQDVQAADIKLNPPQLGPVEIRISLAQDQASVTMSAHHASVREAMEAALPRLREMLADSGINLATVNVSQHAPGQERQASRDDDGSPGHRPGVDAVAGAGDESIAETTAVSTGLLDLFA